MLSDQQIETYRRDGYLVIPRLIQGEQLAQLRALTDRIVDEARGVAANDELYDLEPSHSAALPRVRRLKPAIFKRYAFFHALARDPAITSILAQLLGPAIRQHGGKLNMKSAGYGSPVEWHQDWAFYPHTNDDVLATGIYLDDCDMRQRPADGAARHASRPDLRSSRRRPLLRGDEPGRLRRSISPRRCR